MTYSTTSRVKYEDILSDVNRILVKPGIKVIVGNLMGTSNGMIIYHSPIKREGKYLFIVEIEDPFYYYKDKPYSIVNESAIKIGGEWIKTVNYQCEYENPDGKDWTRFAKEFYELFKKK